MTVSAKHSILDVWQGSEYIFEPLEEQYVNWENSIYILRKWKIIFKMLAACFPIIFEKKNDLKNIKNFKVPTFLSVDIEVIGTAFKTQTKPSK